MLVVVELTHERILGRFADRRFADVLPERAEVARQPGLVVVRDLLVAEEQHLILRERGLELGQLCRREGTRQIDVPDFGPDMRRGGVTEMASYVIDRTIGPGSGRDWARG